ncbi:uncharacterized protein EI97DRAFT_445826 [Westerdykella ornata]|uniref:Uncharacterized protein n=1 Tax=Westerdykella ornata TaxID=318751 RepID=A0A6A6J7J1_WESOR|nr:uncharacterized protein EI97DRAFT_445826 [Westerdykella ornata]KAF2272372.1 hypothetical protein EI97DRAFT_445826 [Westerdykella ornata]
MPPPSPLPTHLYKILPTAPPSPSPSLLPSSLPLSPLDLSSNYIHLSTAHQVPHVLSRFFPSTPHIWLLVLRYADLADRGLDGEGKEGQGTLKWEEGEPGEWFPHYYGASLGKGNVLEVKEVVMRQKDNGEGEGGWEETFKGEEVKLEW